MKRPWDRATSSQVGTTPPAAGSCALTPTPAGSGGFPAGPPGPARSGLRVLGYVVPGALFHARLELLLGLAERPGELRELRATEHQQDDQEDDDQFGRTEAGHGGGA